MNAQKKRREPTIFLICDSNCVRLRKTRTEDATLSKAETEATLFQVRAATGWMQGCGERCRPRKASAVR